MSIRWHLDIGACSHANENVCLFCDHDNYYGRNYPDCPWYNTDGEDEA